MLKFEDPALSLFLYSLASIEQLLSLNLLAVKRRGTGSSNFFVPPVSGSCGGEIKTLGSFS